MALLRSTGHEASYQFGMTELPYEKTNQVDFRHWVGVTKPNTNWSGPTNYVASLNRSRGFPYIAVLGGGNTNNFLFHRVWVKLTWNETDYLLDPAFKVSEPMAGINLATAMGLDTNGLMTSAAGTSTADYAQTLNETNLRNKLRDSTTNLLSYLQSNHPNATVEEVLGGQRIVSSSAQSLSQGLPRR